MTRRCRHLVCPLLLSGTVLLASGLTDCGPTSRGQAGKTSKGNVIPGSAGHGTGGPPSPAPTPSVVPVVTSITSDTFPADWIGGTIDVRADEIDTNSLKGAMEALNRALSQYPAEAVRANLPTVHLVGNLMLYGVPYGGTTSDDAVYVSVPHPFPDGVDLSSHVQGAFHAEFATILLRKYPFVVGRGEWDSNNPNGFKYGASGLDAIRAGKSSVYFDQSLFESGFVNIYAMASPREDVTETVVALFLADTETWDRMSKSKSLWNKLHLATKLLSRVHSSLSWDRFAKMERTK